MTKEIILFFTGLILTLLNVGCTKDYSFEGGEVSKGTLKSIAGDCLPHQVLGVYKKGVDFTDSNYIQIQVRVIQGGSYTIKTDTLSGMSFSGSGYFSNPGLVTVSLKGKGKPTKTGNLSFSVTYDSTVCLASINVIDSAETNKNGYILQGSPGKCINYEVKGDYLEGVALTDSNKIKLTINVISLVNYSITTGLVNGYSFTGSGTFTKTGIQTITLNGKGTPLSAGRNNFLFDGQTTSCSLTINVFKPLLVKGQDHFPITSMSNWTYDDLNHFPDTIFRAITGTMNLNGNIYSNVHETYHSKSPVDYLCRKEIDYYYENCAADKYTNAVKFELIVSGEILFLKEQLKTGDTWTSDEYVGTTLSGKKIYLKYYFTCVDANATLTIYDNTFINVYKILLEPKTHDDLSNIYKITGESRDLYYARGIGLIYTRIEVPNGIPLASQIRDWQVY